MTEGPDLILVVDDEAYLRRLLGAALTAQGYEVIEAANAEAALKAAAARLPKLIILDLGLPDMDGLDVLKALRDWCQARIFILSVRASEVEKVRAFELGADDYVTKPFGMAEFLARIKSALRRKTVPTADGPHFVVGELDLDLERRFLAVGGVEVHLSPLQYRLLQVLALNAGRVVTHDQLIGALWGSGAKDVPYLRVFVRNLRNKIEVDSARPRYLLTDLGVGYHLRAADQ
jgi:two-component system, OmpR family, KDP operon response regulator KdpE